MSRAELSWSEDGRPRSKRFDDIYFAPDGLDESRTVFLQGCGLPLAWADRPRFTVAELGFGSGLNMLAVLQLWGDSRPPGAHLHLFSVEAFPLEPAEARRALSAFPELAELAAPLLRRWPGQTAGAQRIEWPALGAVLDVVRAEAADGLRSWSGPADAWFLDGFAPSRNPEMWRPEVLDLVRARSAPGARLATFTVAGGVRRGLADRGFEVAKAPGHGGKRERLEARDPRPAAQASPLPRVAVVGGGIAGASLARAFARLGVRCTLADPEPGSGASGNPAALVSPRLDAGAGPAARLYAQAFARAADLYTFEADGAVVGRGALRLTGGPKDVRRFEEIARGPLFSPGAMEPVAAETAGERLGEPAPESLWMRDAVTVDPPRLLARWLAEADVRRARVQVVFQDGPVWRVLDDQGAQIAECEVVVLAAGFDSAPWLPDALLEPVRGQASWSRQIDPPGAAASWGGYLAPLTGGGVLFGATHARGSTDRRRRAEDDRRNLAGLAERLPALAASLSSCMLESRASLRAATADRAPLAGALFAAAGSYVLSGLGGRGFTTAPLLAEHVAAMALGAPSPLPRDLAEAVDPARFGARAQQRAAKGRSE